MMKNTGFDDIRPYYDEEIHAAMERIAHSDVFPLLASYVYPGVPLDDVRRRLCAYTSIRELQHDTMLHVNEQVIRRSITAFTSDGLQRLSPQRRYVYVSNHRDIMLDACLLQYMLVLGGFETTEITFGANLMTHPVVVDVGKANKMFRVERPGSDMRQFYKSSLHLSEYIRWCIGGKGESVWIAQRNGRTKDGRDATDQGIIKMFCMSGPADRVEALSQLNIVPVAISYEWEPCDVLKALELYSSQFTRYTKRPGEDLNSIITGVMQQKGRVHIQLCQPLTTADLTALEHLTNSEYHKAVAQLIDRRITGAYRLWPNNFIAHDLLYGNTRHCHRYTQEQHNAFCTRLARLDSYDTCDLDRLRELFLAIYANPVDSACATIA